jgi:hypothetical protein
MKKPYQWLAWLGTALLLLSAGIAAINLYPWYVFAFIFSNVVWILIGVLWKEKSIVVMNVGLIIIYLAGFLLV